MANRYPELPTLNVASMRRLAPNQYRAAIGIAPVREMERLGVGLYYHRAANMHFLALTDAKVHPHDRWLFGCSHTRKGQDSWIKISGHLNSNGYELMSGSTYGVFKSLRFLIDQVENTNMIREQSNLPVLSPGAVIGGIRVFNSLHVLYGAWPAHLSLNVVHEMMHHRAAWLDTNPEMADMPWDLVLRMYGLGELLDLAAEGS